MCFKHNIANSNKYIRFNRRRVDFSLKINRKLRALVVRALSAVSVLESTLEERSEWRICGRRKKRNLSSSFMFGVSRLGRLSHIPHERRRTKSLSKQLHILPSQISPTSYRLVAISSVVRFAINGLWRITWRTSRKMSP